MRSPSTQITADSERSWSDAQRTSSQPRWPQPSGCSDGHDQFQPLVHSQAFLPRGSHDSEVCFQTFRRHERECSIRCAIRGQSYSIRLRWRSGAPSLFPRRSPTLVVLLASRERREVRKTKAKIVTIPMNDWSRRACVAKNVCTRCSRKNKSLLPAETCSMKKGSKPLSASFPFFV